MPPRTAWSSSSSLVSDRISSRPPSRQQHQKSKGKGKATPEPPKSRAVRALEARLDSARGSNAHTKDPKGGCFCQARNHALSSYVPICRRCGLVLCTHNPPYIACPHCASPLLNERDRASLMARLEAELAEQIAMEEAERQRAIEEARSAEGAFPMLPGSQASRTPPPPATTRTVLSLNSGTKKVMMVSSYNTSTTLSRPASRGEDTEVEGRVPGPNGEVSQVTEPLDPGRPWRNVRAGDVRYVRLPSATAGTTGNTGERGPKK